MKFTINATVTFDADATVVEEALKEDGLTIEDIKNRFTLDTEEMLRENFYDDDPFCNFAIKVDIVIVKEDAECISNPPPSQE